jgi:hypothetical protein
LHPHGFHKIFEDPEKRGASLSMIPGIVNKVSISKIQKHIQYAGVATQTK